MSYHTHTHRIDTPFGFLAGSSARASPIGQELTEKLEGELNSDQLFIAFVLLEERSLGTESWFYNYIQTLPKSFFNIPVNFNEEEVKMMEGSYTHSMYESDVAELHQDYNVIW